jgi:hypothetical protein
MKFLFFALLLINTSITEASTVKDKQPIQFSLSAGNLSQQRLNINQKLQQPEYSELTQQNRIELNNLLDFSVSEELTSNQAVVRQDKINNILRQAFAESKLICVFEKELGSNMKKKQCQTMAAKRRAFENTQLNGVGVKQ